MKSFNEFLNESININSLASDVQKDLKYFKYKEIWINKKDSSVKVVYPETILKMGSKWEKLEDEFYNLLKNFDFENPDYFIELDTPEYQKHWKSEGWTLHSKK